MKLDKLEISCIFFTLGAGTYAAASLLLQKILEAYNVSPAVYESARAGTILVGGCYGGFFTHKIYKDIQAQSDILKRDIELARNSLSVNDKDIIELKVVEIEVPKP